MRSDKIKFVTLPPNKSYNRSYIRIKSQMIVGTRSPIGRQLESKHFEHAKNFRSAIWIVTANQNNYFCACIDMWLLVSCINSIFFHEHCLTVSMLLESENEIDLWKPYWCIQWREWLQLTTMRWSIRCRITSWFEHISLISPLDRPLWAQNTSNNHSTPGRALLGAQTVKTHHGRGLSNRALWDRIWPDQ